MSLAAKGIDVRQSSGQLVFRASLKNSGGTKVTSGTIRLFLYALQSDASLQQYDFSNNTFSSSSPTTAYVALSYQKPNGQDSGIWTYALSTLTGFIGGGIYIAQVSDQTGTPTAVPVDQEREFQFGGQQGDLTVTSAGMLEVDLQTVKTHTLTCTANVTIGPNLGTLDTALFSQVGFGVLVAGGSGTVAGVYYPQGVNLGCPLLMSANGAEIYWGGSNWVAFTPGNVWTGPSSATQPTGTYTCSGQPSITVTALAPVTDASVTTDAATGVLATPANKLASNSSGQVPVSNLPSDYLSSTEQTELAATNTVAPPSAATIATAAAAAILTTPANKLATNSSGQVPASNLPSDYLSSTEQTELAAANTVAPPSAAAIATQVWHDATSSSDFTVTGSVGKSMAGLYSQMASNVAATASAVQAILPVDYLSSTEQTELAAANTVSPPSAATIATAAAAAILTTPANKLATTSSGQVQTSNLPSDYLSSTEQTELAAADSGGGGGGGGGGLTTTQANELAAIAANTSVLGGSVVQVTSFVTASGDITIIRGADQKYRDGTAWKFTDPGTWPSLVGATVQLTLRHPAHGDPAPLIITGTILTGPPQIVYFEAAASVTAALAPSREADDYTFDILATLANGDVFPILPEGQATVVNPGH